MRKFLTLFFIISAVFLLSACSSDGFKADYNLEVPDFSFTNQHEEEVSLDDLKGEVWLAQFVFTNCTTVCGPMMYNMAELQDALIEEGVEDYKLVSFTVDPVFDKPDVLLDYLNRFAPQDPSKWEMLTGYKQQEIIDLAKKSFVTIVAPAREGEDQVTHGVYFVLVDQEGTVLKTYNGAGSAEEPFKDYMDDIVQDMKMLIKKGA